MLPSSAPSAYETHSQQELFFYFVEIATLLGQRHAAVNEHWRPESQLRSSDCKHGVLENVN
jgi:hypothetical protein